MTSDDLRGNASFYVKNCSFDVDTFEKFFKGKALIFYISQKKMILKF